MRIKRRIVDSTVMASIISHIENAKDRASDAQHDVKLALSEVLVKAPFASNDKLRIVTMLRDARHQLEDVYKLLASIRIADTMSEE